MAAPPAKPSPSNQAIQQQQKPEATSAAVTENPNVAVAGLKAPPPVAATASTSPPSPVVNDLAVSLAAYESSERTEHYILAKVLLNDGEFEQALTAIEQGMETVNSLPETAMAPFHYLYGTTLLYSIEESTDTSMTTTAPQEGQDDADDMQIAWENLEVARHLLQSLVSQLEQPNSKLELDLAQIALRSADLQRLNGRYAEAIEDYQSCLELRQKHNSNHELDRKIADAHYNLGLSYLSNASELQKEESKAAQAQEHSQKGMECYVQCARILCGQIALLCGVQDPETLLDSNSTSLKAGAKTTGLEEPDASPTNVHAQSLRDWRGIVALLTPTDPENAYTVQDLRQLLEEIQETVEEADRSQDALKQAAQLKAQAQQQAEAEPGFGAATTNTDGSTTTIGFGAPTLSTTAVTEATASAKPMMVIKKKKKKRDEEEDSKPAAVNSKRAKTE